MCESNVQRVIVRKKVGYGAAGIYDYQVTAPEGYRVVSGFSSVAGNQTDPQVGDIDSLVSYPIVSGDLVGYANSYGVYNAWRFQLKLSAAAPIWFGIICERSDQGLADIFLDSDGYSTDFATES